MPNVPYRVTVINFLIWGTIAAGGRYSRRKVPNKVVVQLQAQLYNQKESFMMRLQVWPTQLLYVNPVRVWRSLLTRPVAADVLPQSHSKHLLTLFVSLVPRF